MNLEALRKQYQYDPITGELTQASGKTVGSRLRRGRLRINSAIVGQIYATHLIWLLVHGRLPYEGHVIDHKNNDPSDDRWDNLQEITKSEDCSKDYSENQRQASSDNLKRLWKNDSFAEKTQTAVSEANRRRFL